MNTKSAFFLLLFLLLVLVHCATGQNDSLSKVSEIKPTDTITVVSTHSPVKASIYSMVLPGLGQAYNKKYWKMPLVYAGIGIPLYFGFREQADFKDARAEFGRRLVNDTTDSYREFSDAALLELIDVKRYNRDLLFIVSSLVYILNIVDASVDAHFFDFDVSDDLSLHVQPSFYQFANQSTADPYYKGLTLTLQFK